MSLEKKIFFSSVTSPTCTEKCRCLFARSHLTLWDPMNCSPPGSSVHAIFQARMLEYSPGDLPHPGNKTVAPTASPTLRADSLTLSHQGSLQRDITEPKDADIEFMRQIMELMDGAVLWGVGWRLDRGWLTWEQRSPLHPFYKDP